MPAPERFEQLAPDVQTLPRVLGRFDAITVVVGSIIGSGVFLKAEVIARELNAFGPIISVWVVVGIVTLCGSLALAELAAMLPHAGGPYVYLREAFGPLPAFLWGWTEFWIIRTGSLGALSCATAIYLAQLVPMDRAMQEGLAISIVAGLSAINVIGTHWAASVQNLTTVIKVGFLAFIILVPVLMGKVHADYLTPMWPEAPTADYWRALGVAMIGVLWAYDGWINIAPVAEEIRDPQRNVPLALTIGLFIVIGVYVGANLVYHLVLPMDSVAGSKAVAADVCQAVLGPVGTKIAAIGVMCSTFGAVNSNMLTGPRIYFAMARDGLLPTSLRRIHGRYQTPANAILVQAVWTVILIVGAYAWKSKPGDSPGDAFDALTDFVIFGGSIFYAMAVAAVFVLRRTQPDLPRPYRTWGYPVTPAIYLLAFAGALVSMLISKWEQTALGSLIIVGGAAYYFVVRARQKRAQ